MAILFTNNQDGTARVDLSYINDLDKIVETLEEAARAIYQLERFQIKVDGETIPFDDLTNQQKLELVDDHVKSNIVKIARISYINGVVDAARINAEAYAGIDL
jgi:hypothetical protein